MVVISNVTTIKRRMTLFNRMSNQLRCSLDSIPLSNADSMLAKPLLEKYSAAMKPKERSPAFWLVIMSVMVSLTNSKAFTGKNF